MSAELDEDDLALIQEFLEEAREQCGRAEAILLGLEDGVVDRAQMDELFRFAHTLKGSGMAVGIPRLPEFVHHWEDFLSAARELGTPLQLPHAIVSLFLECNDSVGDFVSRYPGEDVDWDSHFSALESRLAAAELAEVVVLDSSRPPAPGGVAANSIGASNPDDSHAVANADSGPVPVSSSASPPEPDKRVAAQVSADETVRVKLARIDALIRKIGELSVQQELVNGKVDTSVSPELESFARKLSQLCAESHDIAMSLRMVPIKPTVQTLRRTCRDTALKLAKSVEFVADGESAELDLNLVSVLSEALVHVVRNAVDHGIEMPRERVAEGKPEAATVRLSVEQQGGNIKIVVSDDGKGMDPARIRKKAIERGWLNEDDEATLADLFEFVFRPGFSTSEAVTEFSGRGVGLDVVSSKIREFDGSVSVRSEVGGGTEFTILMPLSVAVCDVMRVQIRGASYLVPLHNIQETVAVRRCSVQSAAGGAEMISLRGRALPVYELGAVLAHERSTVRESMPERTSAIISAHHGQNFAFTVDGIIGRQQVVIKPLGHELAFVKGISGSAVLGDGSVGLIVDVPNLIQTRGMVRT